MLGLIALSVGLAATRGCSTAPTDRSDIPAARATAAQQSCPLEENTTVCLRVYGA